MTPWSIGVQQLLTHKPPVTYADMKKPKVCVCGETNPDKFYAKRSTCKACCAKGLRSWRKAGHTEKLVTCACGKQFKTNKPNAKYCGPVCKQRGERAARKARDNAKSQATDAASSRTLPLDVVVGPRTPGKGF